jgi:hypothetical protein
MQSQHAPVREGEHGGTDQQHHPFVLILLVPEPRRAGVAEGHDALDAADGGGEQGFETFFGRDGRQVGKEIAAMATGVRHISLPQRVGHAEVAVNQPVAGSDDHPPIGWPLGRSTRDYGRRIEMPHARML